MLNLNVNHIYLPVCVCECNTTTENATFITNKNKSLLQYYVEPFEGNSIAFCICFQIFLNIFFFFFDIISNEKKESMEWDTFIVYLCEYVCVYYKIMK